MKTKNLLILISLPILMFSCTEQAPNNCQTEQLQIEMLNDSIESSNVLLERFREDLLIQISGGVLQEDYSQTAGIIGQPISANLVAYNYMLAFNVYVPVGVTIDNIVFNPASGNHFIVEVLTKVSQQSDHTVPRWETGMVTLQNSFIIEDGANGGQQDGIITHWNENIPGITGELDQDSKFELIVKDTSQKEKSRASYRLNKATIKSIGN